MTVIERAIESAKNRKYKLEQDLSYDISDLHRKKANGQKEVMQVTIEALEKQIPKKPIVECFSMGYRRCPNCGEYFDCDEDYYLENGEWHYCGKCGQKIDWKEGGTSD